MKRAVVIRTMGDSDVGGAIVDGVIKELTSQELETVKAELEKTKAENTQLGVRKVRDKKDFAKKMRKLKRKYPPARKTTKVEDAILIGWAMLWLGIYAVYDRLKAINRSE